MKAISFIIFSIFIIGNANAWFGGFKKGFSLKGEQKESRVHKYWQDREKRDITPKKFWKNFKRVSKKIKEKLKADPIQAQLIESGYNNILTVELTSKKTLGSVPKYAVKDVFYKIKGAQNFPEDKTWLQSSLYEVGDRKRFDLNLAELPIDSGQYELVLKIVSYKSKHLFKKHDSKKIVSYEKISFEKTQSTPVAVINITPEEAIVPFNLVLNGTGSYDPDGENISVEWAVSNGFISENLTDETVIEDPGLYTVTLKVVDQDGLESVSQKSFVAKAPVLPEPTTLAPKELDISTGMKGRLGFLLGSVQMGAEEEKFEDKRLGLASGLVTDETGSPLEGVKVFIKDHPEFGYTFSRANGEFDLLVNSGSYTLEYVLKGYILSQRKVKIEGRDYFRLDDVSLVKKDPVVNVVELSQISEPVLATSSVSSDDRGERSTTLMIDPGTSAMAVLPNGNKVSLDILSIRATEFTKGENGPERMPGALPGTSAYTFAVNFSVDEADALGAEHIDFDKPLTSYVDNFLGFPAGTAVPLGYFDAEIGVWIPQADGVVAQVVGEENGLALLDLDGDGAGESEETYTAYGIPESERAKILERFSVGESFSRFQVSHFSPYDANYGSTCDGNCSSNPNGSDQNYSGGGNNSCKAGSIINVSECSLGEEISIVGTDFSLFYESRNVKGSKDPQKAKLKLTGDEVNADISEIILKYNLLGESKTITYPPQPNLVHEVEWNGLNKFGQPVSGTVTLDVEITYKYEAYYRLPPFIKDKYSFGDIFEGEVLTKIAAPPIERTQDLKIHLVHTDYNPNKIAGWTLSENHFFDIRSRNIYYGNGMVQPYAPIKRRAFIPEPEIRGAVVRAEDGTLYFNRRMTEDGTLLSRCLWKKGTDGVTVKIAGLSDCSAGVNFEHVDGNNPFEYQSIYISDMHLDTKGNLWFFEPNKNKIFKFDFASNEIKAMVGTGLYPEVSEFDFSSYLLTPAFEADIPLFSFDFYPGTDSVVFSTFKGVYWTNEKYGMKLYSYYDGTGTDGPMILDKIQFDKHANLYFTSDLEADYGGGYENSFLGRLEYNGGIKRINNVDGKAYDRDFSSLPVYAKDSTQIFYAYLLGEEGSIYAFENYSHYLGFDGFGQPNSNYTGNLMKIDQEGRLERVVGGGELLNLGLKDLKAGGDVLTYASGNSIIDMKDGRILVSSWNQAQSFYFETSQLSKEIKQEYRVGSSDGSEIYIFNSLGLHKKTIDVKTGANLYNFFYDTNNRLVGVIDVNGLETKIIRDADGRALSLVAPYGQTTQFNISENKLLAVSNPNGETYTMSYSPEGLLETFSDPNNNTNAFHYTADGDLAKDVNARGGYIALAKNEAFSSKSVTLTTSEGNYEKHVMSLVEGREQSFKIYSNDALDHLSEEHITYANRKIKRQNNVEEEMIYSLDPSVAGTSEYLSGNFKTLFGDNGEKLTFKSRSNIFVERENPSDQLSRITYQKTETILASDLEAESDARIWKNEFFGDTLEEVTTSPMGRVSVNQMDNKGRTVASISAGLAKVSYSYNEEGQMIGQTQGDRSYAFSYGPDGFLSEVVDPLGQSESFAYDAVGRLVQKRRKDGQFVSYGYDPAGNMIWLQNAKGLSHLFAFNEFNLESEYNPPLLDAATRTKSFYNLDKELNQTVYPDGTVVNISNQGEKGHTSYPTHVVTSSGRDIFYDHESKEILRGIQENRTGNGFSLEGSIGYSYTGNIPTNEVVNINYSLENGQSHGISSSVKTFLDSFHRESGVEINGQFFVNKQYDLDNLLVSVGEESIVREQNTGLVAQTNLSNSTENYEHNQYGELVSMLSSVSSASKYQEEILERDQLGRIVKMRETLGGNTTLWEYRYDSLGQLVKVYRDGSLAYDLSYDVNGNRLSELGLGAVAQYDDQDRIISYGELEFEHDLNGNVSLIKNTSSGEELILETDVFANLLKAKKGEKEIRYIVDSKNRRVGKVLDGELVQKFAYKGQLNPVFEETNEGVKYFVYGTKPHVPDYMVYNGVTYKIVSDHLGSVRVVVNAQTGEVAQRLSYSPFGEVLEDTNPGFQPFGFAGGIYDQDTGLVKFGARDYYPRIGRWIQKDPIRFDGGDNNLYRYAGNDLINRLDPSGLSYLDIANVAGFLKKKGLYLPSYSVISLPSGTSGLYNPITRTIYIDTRYTASLDWHGRKRLLKTFYHEYLHSVYGAALDEEKHMNIGRKAQDFADNYMAEFESIYNNNVVGESCKP